MAEEYQEMAREEKIEFLTLHFFGPSLESNETAMPLVSVPSSPAKDAAEDLKNHKEDLFSVDLSLAISRNPNHYFKAPCAGIKKKGVKKNKKKKSLPTEEREEEVLITGPWTMAKKLFASDVGTNSRLTLRKEDAENHINIHFSADALKNIHKAIGVEVKVYDHESKTEHSLMFLRHDSSQSYIFNGDWIRDFVKRRRLKEGDTIGLFWGADSRLHFSVRMRHFI
ncbi:putative B3 domain-containing protein [Cardamine amara subsp. amara]|uniref:B3 domain-containing protein n=1 Tax=Cardamine amara subsp. amara TaxID=228776 RepID=A0ABD1AVQ3_CARAN